MPSAIRDNVALSRFELDTGGVTAFMNYRLTGDVIALDHTETPVAARGRGIASRLVEGVLQIARARGLKIVPRCPFVRAYLAKHPEFSELIRPRRVLLSPGGGSGLLRPFGPRNDASGPLLLTFARERAENGCEC